MSQFTLKGNILRLPQNQENGVFETLMTNRGFNNIDTSLFFSPTYQNLYNPFLFVQMRDAVERILRAIETKERIVIFGDYDVDGVSSVAILFRFLKEAGAVVSYRIPARESDGYGLKDYFLDELIEKSVTLVITVDCGTRDEELIYNAKERGCDIIVTDHHTLPPNYPKSAYAFLNPRDPKSGYPWEHLSGSGVAFKLLHALALTLYPKEQIESILMQYIDIAMLGTIADCMPLVDENRAIATIGLKQLPFSHTPLLTCLCSEKENDVLDSDLVSFWLGPIINSAGRMKHPYIALQALLSPQEDADGHACGILGINEERKKESNLHTKKAFECVDKKEKVLTYSSPTIGHGVIGIVAGKLTETFHKPAFVFREDEDYFVGSARSPIYFDLMPCLESLSHFFMRYGWHAQAAGMTIAKEKFNDFIAALQNNVANGVENSDTKKYLDVDAVISLRDINFWLLENIYQLRPFGQGNKKPIFLIKDCIFDRIEYIGKDLTHLSFKTPFASLDIKAFGFWEHYEDLIHQKDISLIAELDIQVWQKKKRIFVNVKDFSF